MPEFILRRIKKEIYHYRQLDPRAQRLLITLVLVSISGPLTGTFMNAYLWRNTFSLTSVAEYNIALALTVPFGFIVNALLLRKTDINKLYFLSILLQILAAVPLALIGTVQTFHVIIFGIIFGLAMGIHYGSRNFMTFEATEDSNRNYFAGLETSQGIMIGFFAPIIFGWFISLSDRFGLSSNAAYQLLLLATVIVIFLAGKFVWDMRFDTPDIKEFIIRRPSSMWNKWRLALYFRTIMGGAYFFVPTLLILTFLGDEGILGTIQGFTAVASALVIYALGRKIRPNQRLKFMALSTITLLVSAIALGIMYSAPGVLLFTTINSFALAIGVANFGTISMRTLELDLQNGNQSQSYKYFVDNEISIALGRITGMSIFAGLIWFFSQDTALRFAPFIVVVFQLAMLYWTAQVQRSTLNAEPAT